MSVVSIWTDKPAEPEPSCWRYLTVGLAGKVCVRLLTFHGISVQVE